MKDLEKIIEQILPLDKDKLQEGQRYCDQLGKPPGSLGKLEIIYARLHAMFSGPIDLEKKIVLVYVVDNGIVAEGVSNSVRCPVRASSRVPPGLAPGPTECQKKAIPPLALNQAECQESVGS